MKLPNESFYQGILIDHFKGIQNYHLPSGKICDIVNNELAIEVDFTHKWAEAVGQSLQYALETDLRPCIVFIYNYSKDFYLLNSVVPLLKRLCIKVYLIDVFTRNIKLILD